MKQHTNPPINHFVVAYFEAFQDGALTDSEAMRFHQHLADCQQCRDWVDQQGNLIERLQMGATPQLCLSPTAAKRVQRNLYNRMRRTMIMNNVKTIVGTVTAVAVLAVIIGFFIFQARDLNPTGTVEQVTPKLETSEGTPPPTLNSISIALTQQALTPIPPTREIDEQLFAAVTANDTDTVKQFLNAGADPNTVNSEGIPVLVRAIRGAGNTNIIKLLLEFGADVNSHNGSEHAFLPQAAWAGQLEIVQLLLDAGADVNATKDFTARSGVLFHQASAVLHAVDGNHIEVVKLLIAYGADVNQTEWNNKGHALFSAAFYNYPEMVALLLNNGADPQINTNWDTGVTPLHGAADNGSIEAIRVLLDSGVNADIQTNTGLTPIMSVIEDGWASNKLEIFTILLEGGADPNAQDNFGNTALHHAAMRGSVEVIQFLIENGAVLDIENNNGKTALDLAANDEIAEMLREAGAEE
ncbi:MAG: ankyrin repeat domain-containing protein [Ardenticatenaceae bacterium]|nr:ankyrin repeat domain-containing protein [Anaerolineales bacterium]MCB8920535.1 ankyrin repeat domain-containing protein [Ardenticatenaceae bacterium]